MDRHGWHPLNWWTGMAGIGLWKALLQSSSMLLIRRCIGLLWIESTSFFSPNPEQQIFTLLYQHSSLLFHFSATHTTYWGWEKPWMNLFVEFISHLYDICCGGGKSCHCCGTAATGQLCHKVSAINVTSPLSTTSVPHSVKMSIPTLVIGNSWTQLFWAISQFVELLTLFSKLRRVQYGFILNGKPMCWESCIAGSWTR